MSTRLARRLTVLAAVIGAGLMLPAATLAADFPGTSGPDHLIGTADADKIWGLEGDDILEGLAGADWIDGGADHDLIYAGDGNDIVYGGRGRDRVRGGLGQDVIRAVPMPIGWPAAMDRMRSMAAAGRTPCTVVLQPIRSGAAPDGTSSTEARATTSSGSAATRRPMRSTADAAGTSRTSGASTSPMRAASARSATWSHRLEPSTRLGIEKAVDAGPPPSCATTIGRLDD